MNIALVHLGIIPSPRISPLHFNTSYFIAKWNSKIKIYKSSKHRWKHAPSRHLPSKFWEEAIGTTCCLQNWIYHRSIGLMTPYELWYGHKPHVKALWIFGCPAYAYVLENKRNKLDAWENKTIFVGYGDAHGYKAYRLYDMTSKKFIFSRSVSFNESTIANQYKTKVQPSIINTTNDLTNSIYVKPTDTENLATQIPKPKSQSTILWQIPSPTSSTLVEK